MYFRPIMPAESTGFTAAIASQIWHMKYRACTAAGDWEPSIEHTWRRVASSLAEAETRDLRDACRARFKQALSGFRFLPAGRILSGAGTGRDVTLVNTFVMGRIDDDLDGILTTVREAAQTMRMGGGVGFDFSTLRPRALETRGPEGAAAGPLAAMDIFDATCKMLVEMSGRGAMMAVLRCDHPDVESFIDAKADRTRFRNFNLSVAITDDFMEAVRHGRDWPLVWKGEVVRMVDATALWRRIMRRTYDAAEPGVLFIDRINAMNPISWCEDLSATNSCAEQPLPAYGSCPLGSVNLARLVRNPFTKAAALDLKELRALTSVGVRMLDNVIDTTLYPLSAQRDEALTKRRIGLGVTGVADALAMVGEVYGTRRSAQRLSLWLRTLRDAAYATSVELAAEKGPFPAFEAQAYLSTPAAARLPETIRAAIRSGGLRNGALTTIAPTGTTSMLANNVSSGIEPIFATAYKRKVTGDDGVRVEEEVVDYAVAVWRRLHGDAPLDDRFVTAMTLTPAAHVRMQAAAQNWIDSAISKTVNCPADISFEDFERVYIDAYASGCKGCTTYRPNEITGSVLSI